ncbi:MAG: hypothetical protein SGJ09_12050 [Phycisphaerae bacterium]|nr:hypothetical protein [Phycisphaerae bacterium]
MSRVGLHVVVLIAVMSFFGAVSIARATDRYFSDAKELSPNRAFKLEVMSPDNANGRAAFASNFTYTLFDQRTKKSIWSRVQASEERSPLSIEVSDEGNVAARLSDKTVIFLDPKDGRATKGPDLLATIPLDERSRFVSETTAGPMWTGRSRFSFIQIPAASGAGTETYFVVRTFWGRHIVIDLSDGRVVDLGAAGAMSTAVPHDPRAAAIFAAVLSDESRWAIARLTYAAKVDPLVSLEKGG